MKILIWIILIVIQCGLTDCQQRQWPVHITSACYGLTSTFLYASCEIGKHIVVKNVYANAKPRYTNCPEESDLGMSIDPNCCICSPEDCQMEYSGVSKMNYYTECNGKQRCFPRVSWQPIGNMCSGRNFLLRSNYMVLEYYCVSDQYINPQFFNNSKNIGNSKDTKSQPAISSTTISPGSRFTKTPSYRTTPAYNIYHTSNNSTENHNPSINNQSNQPVNSQGKDNPQNDMNTNLQNDRGAVNSNDNSSKSPNTIQSSNSDNPGTVDKLNRKGYNSSADKNLNNPQNSYDVNTNNNSNESNVKSIPNDSAILRNGYNNNTQNTSITTKPPDYDMSTNTTNTDRSYIPPLAGSDQNSVTNTPIKKPNSVAGKPNDDANSINNVANKPISSTIRPFYTRTLTTTNYQHSNNFNVSQTPSFLANNPTSRNVPENVSENPNSVFERPNNVSKNPNNVSKRPNNVSENTHNVSDKSNNVSERPNNVTRKPNTVSENPNSVSDRPNIPNNVFDRPNNVSENPNNVSGKPNTVTENPYNVTGKPNTVTENPHNVTANPNNVSNSPNNVVKESNNVSAHSNSVSDNHNNVSDNPDNVSDNPNNVVRNPNSATDNPKNVSGNPNDRVAYPKRPRYPFWAVSSNSRNSSSGTVFLGSKSSNDSDTVVGGLKPGNSTHLFPNKDRPYLESVNATQTFDPKTNSSDTPERNNQNVTDVPKNIESGLNLPATGIPSPSCLVTTECFTTIIISVIGETKCPFNLTILNDEGRAWFPCKFNNSAVDTQSSVLLLYEEDEVDTDEPWLQFISSDQTTDVVLTCREGLPVYETINKCSGNKIATTTLTNVDLNKEILPGLKNWEVALIGIALLFILTLISLVIWLAHTRRQKRAERGGRFRFPGYNPKNNVIRSEERLVTPTNVTVRDQSAGVDIRALPRRIPVNSLLPTIVPEQTVPKERFGAYPYDEDVLHSDGRPPIPHGLHRPSFERGEATSAH